MTNHEAVLQALADLIATDPTLPPSAIDEPEPSRWHEVPDHPGLLQAIAVQDGPPPDALAFIRGDAEASAELEMEPAIAFAVQAKAVEPGEGKDFLRERRRAYRDLVQRKLADLIAANPTLGLGHETFADVRPPQREDEVAFPNALPAATVIRPVRVLYTGVDAAA